MRHIIPAPRLVPAAVLASMILALAGAAASAVGGASAADPEPACVAPTGTVTDTQRITYLDCQMATLQGRVTKLEPTPIPGPTPVSSAPTPASSATPTLAVVTRMTATSRPMVRGAARKGAVLRGTAGRWNVAPTRVRYQWLRNGKVIRGATGATYRLRRADVRKRVSVMVTASRSGVRTPVTVLSSRTPRIKKR